VVDAGVSFADETAPGTDIIVPDTRYIREHAKSLKGVFITHAHEDHIGAMGYLWDDFNGAPVYVTAFAKQVLLSKLTELGIKPEKGQLIEVKAGEKLKAGNFEAEYIPVAHSIPEAFAIAFKTSYGTFVHTGDYKFDDAPNFGQKTDEKRMKELGKEGVLAVLGDSTNSFKMSPAGSEADIIPHLTDVIKNAKQKVVFVSFASNIGRVLQVAQIAADNGRRVCFLGRTVNKMLQHCKTLGYFPAGLANSIVDAEEIKGFPPEKTLVFASGTQGESNASLTRLSQGADVRGVKLKEGDTVIMSSKMIPGNERAILNTINGLYKRGCIVLSELNDKQIHVSGHGSRADMEKMYAMLKPQMVIPVHGEPAQLIENAKLAKSLGYGALNVFNGQKIVMAGKDKAEYPHIQQHQYPHGRNYIDGLNILDNDPLILKERRKLSFDGVISATLVIKASNGEILSDVQLTSKGVIDEQAQEDILKEAAIATTSALERVFAGGQVDSPQKAAEVMEKTIKRALKINRGKQPTVLTHIITV